MLIDCPGCGTSYHIVKAVLGAAGRRVVCPRCDSIWFVGADGMPGAEEPAGGEVSLAAGEICLPGDDDASSLAEMSESLSLPPHMRATPGAAAQCAPRQAKPTFAPRRAVLREMGAALALIGLAMALIGFRAGVVEIWPRAATAYAAIGLPVNLRGLAFAHVRSVTANDGFENVLKIAGNIVNLRARATPIPPIRIAVRDRHSRTLYSWVVTAPKRRLGARQSLAFHAELAAPPKAGHDILVRFDGRPPRSLAALWQKAKKIF